MTIKIWDPTAATYDAEATDPELFAADPAFTRTFLPGTIVAAPSGGNDTAAIQAQIDAIAPGGWLFFPVGDYQITQLLIDKPLRISGMGADTRLIAHSTATDYLIYVQGSVGMEQGDSTFAYGVTISDLFLEGDERGVAAGGIRFRDAQRCSVSNVFIQNFQKSGIYFQRRVRNSFFDRVFVKNCGDLDNDRAHFEIVDTGTGDGHNNLYFVGCESTYPYGAHVLAVSTNTSSPTRQVFFTNCMFHGATPGDVNPSYGVNYTADYRNIGVVLWQENARNFFFQSCRMQLPGPGWPAILMRESATVDEINATSLSDCSLGACGEYEATFTAATDDVLTFGADHNLATGALVRVASSTTLPAGLTAATDYYVIRVSSTTIKLATSRLNADAGTAVDITDTGTGTHTLTAQETHVLVESGTFISGSGTRYEGEINRAHIVDKVGTAKVSQSVEAGSTLYEGTSIDGSPTVRTVYKTADETVTSSTTLQADNDLLFEDLPADSVWQIEGVLFVTGEDAGDLKVQFEGPAGAAGSFVFNAPTQGVTTTAAGTDFVSVALGASRNIGAVDASEIGVMVRGLVTIDSTAGDLSLTWAQRVSDPTATTLKARSHLTARRIA